MATNPQWAHPHTGGAMSLLDYLRLEQSTSGAKYEYLNGVARLISGGSVGHDRIARNAAYLLDEHFASGPCTVFGSDVQVLIGIKASGKEQYMYPDATVSCDVADRRRGNKLIRSPRIVIEVLSPSTEPSDRGEKLEAYKACPTIQEIVLVSQFAQHVELHRRHEEEDVWDYVMYGPGAIIDLTSIDVQIAIDDLYRGIDFDEPLQEA